MCIIWCPQSLKKLFITKTINTDTLDKSLLNKINKIIIDHHQQDIMDPTLLFQKYNIILFHGDILKLKVDCIVNAANEQCLGCFSYQHKCIDNIIHSASGPELRWECKKILGDNIVETGNCIITKGYNLLSKHVIHAVGPVYDSDAHNECCKLLELCYNNILDTCKNNKIKNIAFCSVSTGVFGFPKDHASKIAVDTVTDWLEKNKDYDLDIIFCTFDKADYLFYKKYNFVHRRKTVTYLSF